MSPNKRLPEAAPWLWIDANRTKRINFRSARKSRFNQWRERKKASPGKKTRRRRAAKTGEQPLLGFTAFRKQGKVVRERLTCSCCKSKRFQYWNIDPALAAILRHIETEWEADRESARGRSSREGGKKQSGKRVKPGAEWSNLAFAYRTAARNGVDRTANLTLYWTVPRSSVIDRRYL